MIPAVLLLYLLLLLPLNQPLPTTRGHSWNCTAGHVVLLQGPAAHKASL
jgi:hypothetical protein